MLFVDLEIARRIEHADAAGAKASAKVYAGSPAGGGAATLDVGGGVAVFAGVDSPITQVLALGMNGPVTANELDELETFYRSRGSAVFVELSPFADPTVLALFNERGYRVVEFSSVLIRSVQASDAEWNSPVTVQVRIPRGDEVPRWSHTVASGFFEDAEIAPGIVEVLESYAGTSSMTALLVEVEGVTAGGGALSRHQGVAWLAGQSTLPAMRKRGVQAALIGKSLAIAADSGCTLAIAATLPGSVSQRNFERQGFAVAYTRCKMGRSWQ